MLILANTDSHLRGETQLFTVLINVGVERAHVLLPPELHCYLVSCLCSYLRDRDVVHQTLALTVLRASEKHGEQGNACLKRAGDGALLLAGFYPERARRLNVSSRYFQSIGQSAFGCLSARLTTAGKPHRGKLYDSVATGFGALARVLDASRKRTEWEHFQRFMVRLQ